MKNNISFVVPFTVSALLLTACTPSQKNTPSASVAPTPTIAPKVSNSNSELMMSAYSGNGSVVCTISKTDGSDSITFSLKGKKTKAEGSSLSGSKKGMGYMINDGTYAYIWSDQEKTGIKMDLSKATPDPSAKSQFEDYSNDNVQKMYEDKGYSYDCKKAALSDSDFIPPQTVTFTDLSQMMESTKKMMPSGKTGATPSAEDMKKIQEEMMKIQGQ